MPPAHRSSAVARGPVPLGISSRRRPGPLGRRPIATLAVDDRECRQGDPDCSRQRQVQCDVERFLVVGQRPIQIAGVQLGPPGQVEERTTSGLFRGVPGSWRWPPRPRSEPRGDHPGRAGHGPARSSSALATRTRCRHPSPDPRPVGRGQLPRRPGRSGRGTPPLVITMAKRTSGCRPGWFSSSSSASRSSARALQPSQCSTQA